MKYDVWIGVNLMDGNEADYTIMYDVLLEDLYPLLQLMLKYGMECYVRPKEEK